jgi:hypothetical protein
MPGDAPALTLRDLNRATLARQGLIERLAGPIPRAVEAIGALQSQHPEWPLMALGSRLEGISAAKLEGAFAERRIVRASLMRITLHVVSAADFWPMHAVVSPFRLDQWRLIYKSDPTAPKLQRELAPAEASVRSALANRPLRRDEIAALLAAEVPESLRSLPHDGLWRHFAATHALVQVPQAGERYGGGRYALAERWLPVPADGTGDVDRARRHLLRRYLGAFGPATLDDALAWIGRGRGGISPWRAALAELSDELVEVRDDDVRMLWDLADAPRPGGDAPAPPRLLARWDSLLLAHTVKGGRRRVLPQRHHATVNRKNGDVLPTFLVDGFVAGTWEPSLREAAGASSITLRPFGRLPRGARAVLEEEAMATLELLYPQATTRQVHVSTA